MYLLLLIQSDGWLYMFAERGKKRWWGIEKVDCACFWLRSGGAFDAESSKLSPSLVLLPCLPPAPSSHPASDQGLLARDGVPRPGA